MLARALEYAVHGVFVAWDYPVLGRKVQKCFDPVMAAHVPPADADLIRSVWENDGRSRPDPDLTTVIGACMAVVNRPRMCVPDRWLRSAPRTRGAVSRRTPRRGADCLAGL
jgi:hypothetical protein